MGQNYQSLKNYDLRKLQLAQVDMLKDLKKICEKHNIKFYLSSGTLLGAVRHRGFIPWDNDIDVEMPRDDYERFVKLTEKEIGPEYFIQTYETDEKYYRAYARMRLNNSTMMYPWESKYDIHHGVWLDIFPLIGTNNKIEWKIKKLLVRVANVLGMQDYFEDNEEAWLAGKGNTVVRLLKLFFKLTPKKLREKLQHVILRKIKKPVNKKYVSVLWCELAKAIPKSVYEGEPAMVEFEGEPFPAVPKYDQWLTLRYGDYMTPPPECDRATHEGLIIDLDNDYTKYMEIQ